MHRSEQWDYGEALEQNSVAATVVMGRDYDCDVAMSHSYIYHCAYTSVRVGQSAHIVSTIQVRRPVSA